MKRKTSRASIVNQSGSGATQGNSDRHKRLNRYLSWLYAIVNLTGALFCLFFFTNMPRVTDPALVDTNVLAGIFLNVTATLALIIISVRVSWMGTRSVLDWHRQACQSTPNAPAPESLRTVALELPLRWAVSDFVMWGLAGVLFGLANSTGVGVGSLLEWRFSLPGFISIFLVSLLVGGPISAALLFLATERVWKEEIPLFFTGADPFDSIGRRVQMRQRLLLLFILSFMPVALLAGLSSFWIRQTAAAPNPASFAASSIPLLLFMAGLGLLINIGLALTLGASLLYELGRLRQGFEAIGQGNLKERLPVTAVDEFGALARSFNQMAGSLQQRDDELQTIYQISQEIYANIDLAETLQTILKEVRSVIPYDGAEICLYDPAQNLLRVRAWAQAGGEENGVDLADTRGRSYILGEGLTGQVGAGRRSMLIPDLDVHPLADKIQRRLSASSYIECYLGAPLLFQGNLTGTLQMIGLSKAKFNERDLKLVESIAPQAAVAIANAAAVLERERQLQATIAGLRVEVDQARMQRQVQEITDSDYFQNLQNKIGKLRKKNQ